MFDTRSIGALLALCAFAACSIGHAADAPKTIALGKAAYLADDVRAVVRLITDVQIASDPKLDPKLLDPSPQPSIGNHLIRPVNPEFDFGPEPVGLDPRPVCELYAESWTDDPGAAACACEVHNACRNLHLPEFQAIVQAVFAGNRAASGGECTSPCL